MKVEINDYLKAKGLGIEKISPFRFMIYRVEDKEPMAEVTGWEIAENNSEDKLLKLIESKLLDYPKGDMVR